MTALVVGATGATGRLLVQQLLERGGDVRVIARSADRLPDTVKGHARLSVVEASLLDLDDAALGRHVAGCDAVASCLGHTPTFEGLFGPPRRLVAEAVRRLCRAVRAGSPAKPVRFVLMNTTGCRNRDLAERPPLAERCIIGLLRWVLPPHADNEAAADVLRVGIGQRDDAVEWVVVRPDNLIDSDAITAYDVHPSPVRGVIFDTGTTSRIQVAHFMLELITDDALWERWRGRMPVIYDRGT